MGFLPPPGIWGHFPFILYETTNKIQLQYRNIVLKNDTGLPEETACIGIENSTGSSGVQYSFQTPFQSNFRQSRISYTFRDNIFIGILMRYMMDLSDFKSFTPEPGIQDMISLQIIETVGVDVISNGLHQPMLQVFNRGNYL